MTGEGSRPPDVGLAAERTTLSWTRTALVAAVLGALMLRTGLTDAEPWLVAGAITAFVDAIAIALIGRQRSTAVRRRLVDGGAIAAPIGIALVAALTTATVALTSLATVLA